MLKGVFIGLFLASIIYTHAQITTYIGVRQNALGNVVSNLNDVWSCKNNSGAFAFMKKSQASLVYQNRFLVSELSTQSLVYGHCSNFGNVGFFIQHSGFKLYRTMQLGGTYSMSVSPRLGLGINFNYQQTKFGDVYGVKHHFIASLGVQYKLNKDIFLAVNIQNINRSKVSDFQNERLPTTLSIGVLYNISPNVVWVADLEKEIASNLNIKTGLELKAHDNFKIRLGINSYPFQSSFGFGVYFKRLVIDMAAIWHANIGLSPSLGIVYEI